MAAAMAASACMASTVPPSSSSSSSSAPSPILRQAFFPASIPDSSASLSASPSLHNPSLQFANMMWFKGPYNTQIFVGESEPADSVVKRFRRAVMQAGVISECRRRRFFETPHEVAKRKLQAAQRRRSKSRYFTRVPSDQKKDKDGNGAAVADDDDNDNWEYEGMA